MNNWGEIKKLAIVEADDFQDKYDRNGLEMLFYWKAKYPKFKITLFTIPNKISDGMLELIFKYDDWIELAVHGWDHDSNFECWSWDYDKTKALMNRLRERLSKVGEDFLTEEINFSDGFYATNNETPFKFIFKAPGWTITDKCSGYVADPSLPISKDPQGVYRALQDLDFIVFDRHYDKEARPVGAKIICVDCNPDIVHMHTWDMVTGDLAGKNGFRQVEELHGVPWDQNTEFKFVSEAWEEELFKPCQE